MSSIERMLVLLFAPIAFTAVFICDAVHHLYSLGKSKTRIAKERNSIPAFKKFILLGYVEKCNYHVSTAKKLCVVWWGYLLITLTCVLLFVLSAAIAKGSFLFYVCVFIKVFVFDVPINIYGLLMTRHSKKGGIEWVWTKNE